MRPSALDPNVGLRTRNRTTFTLPFLPCAWQFLYPTSVGAHASGRFVGRRCHHGLQDGKLRCDRAFGEGLLISWPTDLNWRLSCARYKHRPCARSRLSRRLDRYDRTIGTFSADSSAYAARFSVVTAAFNRPALGLGRSRAETTGRSCGRFHARGD